MMGSMKRTLPLLSVLLAWSPLAGAAPAAPGAVPGPSSTPAAAGPASDAATPLPLGASSNRTLPPGGLARFEHRVEGPGLLRVAVGGPEDLGVQVCTPGKIGAVAGWSDEDLDGDWTERLEVPVFEAGVYEVMVQVRGDAEHGGAFFLAAAFEPGEPAASERLTQEQIERARALADPRPLGPGVDLRGEIAGGTGPGHVRVYTLEAAPGLYAVTAASGGDVELHATSSTLGTWSSAWEVRGLFEYADADSDADFAGDPGREALVIDLPDRGRAWVAVSSPVDEAAAFTLRLQPLEEPAKPFGGG